ncbi:MAG: hypothetical protein UT81_C0024G0014, partial [Parcubacteria group bacterium GW2011_GWA2_40_14]
ASVTLATKEKERKKRNHFIPPKRSITDKAVGTTRNNRTTGIVTQRNYIYKTANDCAKDKYKNERYDVHTVIIQQIKNRNNPVFHFFL